MDQDFSPPAPTEAYFDSMRGAWVLSRYADVRAALQERALFQASFKGQTSEAAENDAVRPQMFATVKAEMAQVHAGRWRVDMESTAKAVMREASAGEEIDLVGDFIHPWTVAVLMRLSGAPLSLGRHLSRTAACLLYEKAWSLDLDQTQTPRAMRAHREFHKAKDSAETALASLLNEQQLSISQSMFLGVSQTLPALLGKSWLALMRNRDQLERLAANPGLMGSATIELLRYAGIVHTLYRVAMSDVEIGSVRIAKGERADLKVASGNFDPERFEDPYVLDLRRRPQTLLSLGSGIHACAGAAMVREAFAAATPVFLAAQPVLTENQRVRWMGDSTLHWPLAVRVNLGRNQVKTVREYKRPMEASLR